MPSLKTGEALRRGKNMAENGKINDDNILLDVKGLKKYFPITGGLMRRVVRTRQGG